MFPSYVVAPILSLLMLQGFSFFPSLFKVTFSSFLTDELRNSPNLTLGKHGRLGLAQDSL
jgi:hypothetical protein